MPDLPPGTQPQPVELRSEPVPPAGSGTPRGAAPEDPQREARSRPWIVATGLVLVVSFVVVTENDYPPIDASLTTSLPSPGSMIELTGATTDGPIEASLGSFVVNQIPPGRAAAVEARGKEILIRMRVSRDGCRELEAEIGGSCAGPPRPPLHALERLTVRSPAEPVKARISSASASTFRLGQNAEPARQGPPGEWSLTENARRTEVSLICHWRTPLAVTLLPGQAEVECSPDEAVFELLLVNRKAYAPTLSLNEVHSLEARVSGRRAAMTVDDGVLRLGGAETEIHEPEAARIALAAGPNSVALRLLSSAESGATETSLRSSAATRAAIDGDDELPSRLDRDELLKGLAYSAILGMLGTLVVLLIAGRRKR
jgi:hypothetical protein